MHSRLCKPVAAFVVAMACFGVSACSKDDSAPVQPEGPIKTDLAERDERTVASIVATAARPAGAVDYVRPESVMFQNAVARAKELGRPLLVDVSGAWCSPCQKFNYLRANGDETMSADEFKAIVDQFEFLYLEEEHLSNGWEFSFLPFEVTGIPTFAAYDPETDRWQKIPWAEATLGDMGKTLSSYLATRGQAPQAGPTPAERLAEADKAWDAFIKKTKSRESITGGDVWDAYDWILVVAELRSIRDAVDMVRKMTEISRKRADVLESHYPDYPYSRIGIIAEEKHGLTFPQIEAQYPDLAKELWVFTHVFTRPLRQLVNTKGTAAAASICRKLDAFVTEKYPLALDPVPADAKPEERKEIEDANAELERSYKFALMGRQVECSILEARSRMGNLDELKAFARKLDKMSQDEVNKELVTPYTAMRVAAVTGLFDLAMAAAERAYDESLKHNEASRKSGLKEVEKLNKEIESASTEEEKAKKQEKLRDEKLYLKAYDQMDKAAAHVLEERLDAFRKGVECPLSLHELFY